MNLFQKISKQEQQAICDYIYDYAGEDGESVSLKMPLEHILRFWNVNKENLFKIFKGELILSKEINFQRPEELIEGDIIEMLSKEGLAFTEDYHRMIYNLCGRYHYYSDMNSPTEELRSRLESLISAYVLTNNLYVGETFTVPSLHGRDIIVSSGSKATKMLRKIALARDLDLDDFEKFRIAHSMCLNQKSMHGNLCLSIHPLDFMTMSDNYCDWDSCMSWQNSGSYRQGTVEMMNSAYIVIAYLAAEKDMEIGSISWSNKKWRQLFVVTPEMIMGIKQYPYYSEECEGIALNWLREIAQKNIGWGPYCKNVAKINNNQRNTFAEINQSSKVSLYMNHMYNDIGNDQRGYISINFPADFYLNLSGESECMECGDLIDIKADDEMLLCQRCANIIVCNRCGCRICDDIYYFGDECYCDECYCEITTPCEFCDEVVGNDSINEVYIKHKNNITGFYIQVCDDCLNSFEFQRIFGLADREFGYYSVDSKNFKDEAWDYFSFSETMKAEYITSLSE